MSGYGDKSYWDTRYKTQEGKYDWYLSYSQLCDVMLPYLNVKPHAAAAPAAGAAAGGAAAAAQAPEKTPEASGKRDRSSFRTLIVGCGNSDLSENMYDDGFTNQVSIDYSDVVIQKMNELLKDSKPNLKFETMDARELTFKDAEFDLIVDKGTLDAILCGNDSATNSNAMLEQCARVLKPGGVFFVFTYGQPQSRLSYLDKPKFGWKCTHQTLAKTKFMYVLQKPAKTA